MVSSPLQWYASIVFTTSHTRRWGSLAAKRI